MKNRKWINFIIFPTIVCLLVGFLNILLDFNYTEEDTRIKFYYNEPENSLDVLMVGPSTFRCGFIPTLCYQQTGITAYNYTSNGSPILTMRYMIEEALKTQQPKVIVVEISSVTNGADLTETRSQSFLNNINDSELKTRAEKDLLSKKVRQQLSVPFIKNHYNWTNIATRFMYEKAYQKHKDVQTYLKGYSNEENKLQVINKDKIIKTSETTPLTTELITPLNTLLDFCKTQQNTKFLFVKMAKYSTTRTMESLDRQINWAGNYIEENGFDFVDLSKFMFADDKIENNPMQIDTNSDFANETHLNYFGAQKFTKFFGNYLMRFANSKGIDFSHSQEVDDNWNQICEKTAPYFQLLEEKTTNNTPLFRVTELDFFKKYM